MADIAVGNTMANQAISSSLSNLQTGYGAANAANQLLGTASSLKYSPLGSVSSGTSTSSGDSQSSGSNVSSGSGYSASQAYNPNATPTGMDWSKTFTGGNITGTSSAPTWYGGLQLAEGGDVPDDATSGGFVSRDLSPSDGAQVDDVDARLNAGEFVIPRDVALFKGQEFFYKLMAQARLARATLGNRNRGTGYAESHANG